MENEITVLKEIDLFKPKVKNWIDSLKESTARAYVQGFFRYCKYLNLEPSVLIDHANEDYENRVAPNKLRTQRYLKDFIQHLKNNTELSNMSKLGYINGVRNFYAYNDIQLLPIKNVGITAQVTDKTSHLDVLKLSDVRKFVDACGVDQKLLKALALTLFSSGQAQKEIQNLKGRDLKNIVNGIAIVKMTRQKTKVNYSFLIGKEALDSIHDYKPVIQDEEFVFTMQTDENKDRPLDTQYVDGMFARHCEKLGFDRGYFRPHRVRHYWKTVLSGKMDRDVLEFLTAHKLQGTQGFYFNGIAKQDDIIKEYLKVQEYLTVYGDKEALQRQYNELISKTSTMEDLKRENDNLKITMEGLQHELNNLKQDKGITKFENINEQYQHDLEEQRAHFEREILELKKMVKQVMQYPLDPAMQESLNKVNKAKQ